MGMRDALFDPTIWSLQAICRSVMSVDDVFPKPTTVVASLDEGTEDRQAADATVQGSGRS